jgi:riboflavin kinase/FMN adenylyltransferase
VSPPGVWRSVLTLGTFDGVHRGHQALVRKVVGRARALRAQSVVLSFGMPPRHKSGEARHEMAARHAGEPPAKPVLLTTLAEKLQVLKRLGVENVQVLIFDRKTASTRPEDFFCETILRKHHAVEMVVGPRGAFGRNRSGRLPLLKRLGREYGVRLHVVSSVEGGRGSVSSRRIRALITRGNIEKANALLGYPYSISGRVVHGDHRGRRLGFPTANIQPDPGKMMPRGVYWVKVLFADQMPFDVREAFRGFDGLCNVGVRPTFMPRSHQLHCEVFLLKGGKRLYGKKMRVVFLRKIRSERRFASAAALQRRIVQDLKAANLYKNAHFSI